MSGDDITAGEYVLGTLSFDERNLFERDLAKDAALRASVANWERRLSPLARSIEDVEPPPGLFAAIERRLPPSFRDEYALRALRRSRSLWRTTALSAAALAAALALYVALPEMPAIPDAGFISVVDRGGALPPLIVRVDTTRREIAIQTVAADTPDGRSLELWVVRDGRSPRSLGIMNAGFTTRSLPSDLDSTSLSDSVFAVSVEPAGGSPTGGPTGPVIYTGKLIPITRAPAK